MKMYYDFFVLFCQIFFVVCIACWACNEPITWHIAACTLVAMYLIGVLLLVCSFVERRITRKFVKRMTDIMKRDN